MEYEDKAVGIMTDTVDVVTCSQCGCEIDTTGLEPFLRIECPDCGSIETVPAKLGPFHLVHLIGTGGMGGVYGAIDESLGRKVAIKVMLKSIGADHKFVESFKREAQAVARLNHPNIAQIYSFGQEKGQPYIVMELVNGERFDKMIEESKQVHPALAMHIGIEVAKGLNAADEAGLIHGDVKPENILLDEKGMAKIVDFGIATVAHQSQEGIWGTPYYIPPEKVRRQKADARADMYSLGATLYHAITGQPPFEGETPVEVVKARLGNPAPPVKKYVPNINPAVEQVIGRMLQEEPARRHPTYASLISDMQKCLQALGGMKAVKLKNTVRKTLKKKRTGKIRVQKQTGNVAPETKTQAAASTPAQRPATEARPKVVIKKKKKAPQSVGPRKTVVKPRTRKTAAADTEPAEAAAATADKASAPASAGRSRPQKKKSFLGLWIFLILLLVFGGVGWLVYADHKKKQAALARAEFIALEDARTTAKKGYVQIKATVTNIIDLAESVTAYAEQASNAVLVVTGKPYSAALASSRPAAPAAAATPDRPAAPAAPPPRPRPSGDAPPGMMSREELDRLRNEEAAPPKPPEPEPDAAEPDPDPEPVVASTGGAAQNNEIRKQARSLFMELRKIQRHATEAEGIRVIALQIAKGAQELPTSVLVKLQVRELKDHYGTVQAIHSEAENAAKAAKGQLDKILSLKTEIVEAREAAERAREEAARLAAEEEARRRAAEAQASLIQNELEMTKTAAAKAVEFAGNNSFAEAVAYLQQDLANYQTDEGKAPILLIKEQCSRLVDLKAYMIKHLTSVGGYKWGWGIKTSQPLDILAASKEGLRITGGTNVTWAQVGRAQMLKIIKYCLEPNQVGRTSGTILANQNLNAAIYCLLMGGTREADVFATRARGYNSAVEPDLDRLLKAPDLPPAPAE